LLNWSAETALACKCTKEKHFKFGESFTENGAIAANLGGETP
jgi:hypothetical protein